MNITVGEKNSEKKRSSNCRHIRRFIGMRFPVGLLVAIVAIIVNGNQEMVINTEYLGPMFHKATSAALLQAKAKKELARLPEAERILYDSCVREARSLLRLVKCVANVIKSRNRLQHPIEPLTGECSQFDGDIVFGFLKRWMCLQRREPKKEESLKESDEVNGKQKILENRYRNVRRSSSKKPTNSLTKIRQKRTPPSEVSPRCLTPVNVERLRSVQKYFDQTSHILNYLYSVTKSNKKFFEEVDGLKVNYEKGRSADTPVQQFREFVEQLEGFEDKAVTSILSPRLLNVMRETEMDPESKRWLSPTMLSFQDEGALPLPRLLRLSTSSHCETLGWVCFLFFCLYLLLDLLMDMTGAAKMLNSLVVKFGDHMEKVETELFPHVLKAEQHDNKFRRLHSLTSISQRRDLLTHGYAVMNPKQMDVAYGENGLHVDSDEIRFNADENVEQVFESEILYLSELDEEKFVRKVQRNGKLGNPNSPSFIVERKKRDLLDQILPMTHQQQIGGIRTLEPFAFSKRIRNANVMGPYIISPHAFYMQVISPTLLHMDIISPRAFIATIFSPVVLVARVLSPAAFRLMLFSPLALVVWVMVPEAFTAKIFAPKLLDARILSPDTFSVIVLSPAAGVLRAGSPNAYNVLVLSPAFGTYQLLSGNRHVIQILSPGILGIDEKPLLREPADEAKERSLKATAAG